MLKLPEFKILEDITEDQIQKNLDIIVETLFHEIKIYLNLEPYLNDFEFLISNEISNKFKPEDIFNIGITKQTRNGKLLIEIYKNYIKYLPFLLLREIYNLFIPIEQQEHELVQIVVNQIIMNDLSKFSHLNEWRTLIRENLEQYDLLSVGFNRLIAFDRLENFFKLQGKNQSYNPTQFFFYYIRRNSSLITDKTEKIDDDIHNIFFDAFQNFTSKSMNNDEIIETVRCLKEIFHKVKNYRDLLSYKTYFQEFKEKGQLKTELSLRKFIKNMDWIKNFSFIAPSYYVIWNTINVCLITVFFRFNPHLEKSKIFKIIESLPFFISPRISRNSFDLDLFGFFVIPKVYLDDLEKFVKKLVNDGYIIKTSCLLINSAILFNNLNYFRPYSQKHRIITPKHNLYEKRYEIEFKLDFGTKFHDIRLNLLDFLVLDRIRFFSVSGLGFERRAETLQSLKSDLLNDIVSERTIIKNLKSNLVFFHSSDELRTSILQLLESNKQFGFFYIKGILEDYLELTNFMKEVIIKNPEIKSITQLQQLIDNQNFSLLIEKNLILKDIASNYFISKEKYEKNVEKIKKFYNLFNSCYNLKIFDLKAIKTILVNKKLVDTIYKKKEEKLKKTYENFKLYKITSHEIDRIIDKFISHKPPIIQPNLLNTIITTDYVNDIFKFWVNATTENTDKLDIIKKYFPIVVITKSTDLFSDKALYYVQISIPYITKKEKYQLYSIIYNIFKGDIVYGKTYLSTGFIPAFSIKNFYDFDNKKFFYTSDLFEQYSLYSKRILEKKLKSIPTKRYDFQEKFWLKERNLMSFVNRVNYRVSKEKLDFDITYLNKLLNFHLNLKDILMNVNKFKEIKREYYFYNYIKLIKFIPALQNFGFGQYFLYLYPTDMNELDFKLLLLNTFQKVKYPACIDDSNSLFIKYIMPHKNPNLKYLNWITKSKKIIREYCAFFIKKLYQICHFNYNLSPEGWIYDKDRFKIYMQNILFNPDYEIQIPEVKEFIIESKSVSSYFEPESPEYESLTSIYNWQSIDIKSYLATQKHSKINHITSLLKRNLIFPYISLKNLDLHNRIRIILPNVKPDLNKTLVKIFSFFNYGFVYEIEGEYFIYGFPEEVKFENGLMIKLYLPKCELHEFVKLFDLLFEYLEIKDYLILNDLVDGSQLLKSIYGSLDFLKEYNPLKNLIWNPKDKKWMNHKLFTQKFEPIYPDLIPKEES